MPAKASRPAADTFALALLMHRERLRMTAGEIATAIGMPRRTWENYEQGIRTPPAWIQRLVLSHLKNNRK